MTLTSLAVEALFSRLFSPVPVVKLLVCERLASLLRSPQTKAEVFEALVNQLKEAKFESEVNEVLTVPVLARESTIDTVDILRSSIQLPSILSDSMLSLIGGRKFLVDAWSLSHSGPAPAFYPTESLEILRKAQIIPPFVGMQLSSLEKDSGLPVLRQWCFEFDALDRRSEEKGAGQFAHFTQGDSEHKVGQFISIAGQRARSAYLRTLAIAVDRWGMPADFAEGMAEAVRPIDSHLLGLVPTKPPAWTDLLVPVESVDEAHWAEKINSAIAESGGQTGEVVLHADFLVGEQKRQAAQLELTTVYSNRDDLGTNEVFARHEEMLGQQSYDIDGSFTYRTPAEAVPGGKFVPAVMPLADDYLGFFNGDLMSRFPYGPRLFARAGELKTRSESNHLIICAGSEVVGQVSYWNRNWSPTHLKFLKPSCGVATTVTREFATTIERYTRMRRRTVWRLNLVSRTKEYGDWNSSEFSGATV
jgi:hypothetical protein